MIKKKHVALCSLLAPWAAAGLQARKAPMEPTTANDKAQCHYHIG